MMSIFMNVEIQQFALMIHINIWSLNASNFQTHKITDWKMTVDSNNKVTLIDRN